MPDLTQPAGWLPLAFMIIMGLAILIYVVLDGYDLGVGMLLVLADDAEERDLMVASIGPFWDANETWLVLGIGVLLTAFPLAHGVILGALYLPVAAMLAGLILRGVAFDFRIKAQDRHRQWWNRAFFVGSLLAALAQGYMLGLFILGFARTPGNVLFAALIGLGLAAGYCLLGAGWLLLKCEGTLQQRAATWGWWALWLTALGIAGVSLATPLLSPDIFARWFAVPNVFLLAPFPIITAVLFAVAAVALRRLPAQLDAGDEGGTWLPFAAAIAIFVLAFHGLAYSLFPWVVPQRLDIWQAAADPESLAVIFAGVAFVLPLILAYTVFAYWVFRGKATHLGYG
ncbi:cytochrome d ubiquinol oxidase subunit II [Dechloromonas sp. XY25]|uniref:Cytochrome d ubiquinol oxidase subunit II n=1 Tax=Dechloromonas hankyongensis TaxID=2908002 RepID=A0ABS9K6G5_9RHOO|nr:cytochrome d ubiquinol oxidase subunit II [Dechloromonas hankyongensis]MCG2578762.1 cytochrome d ubiquinol oxidase subunit II [Dechloromonas hankyongensis]